MAPLLPARQETLPRAKLMTSDDFGNFLTHVTTFHDLCMTLLTNGDDILMTLKTIGEDTLTTLMNGGEDTLTIPVSTRDYLVTTPHDITDDPCDDIKDQEQLAGSNTYQGSWWGPYQVMTRMTR